jgi:hypothetical protein
MRNVIKSRSLPIAGIVIIIAALLISLTATMSFSSIFSYTHNAEENPVSTDENVTAESTSLDGEIASNADRSDTNTDENTNLYTEIPGVGVFFGKMLDSLINLTRDSEKRFQSLTHHLPLVFPDLYKVLITL